jgi:hypothetical protein
MPKAAVAERILETVTTPNRAASIVGDLLEEVSDRNPLGFWFGLLRIFASHVCHDLRIHWFRMIWLGFSELLTFVVLAIVFMNVWSILAPHYYMVNYFLNMYALPIFIGWHVAKRSHGSEFAAGVAFICMGSIFMAAMLLTATQREMPAMIIFKTLKSALGMWPVLAGAFLFRYRANRRHRELPLENG